MKIPRILAANSLEISSKKKHEKNRKKSLPVSLKKKKF